MEKKQQELTIGDKISIYGKETIFEGFKVNWNSSLEKHEIIILTTKRGDPFERSLDVIEFIDNPK